MNEISKWLEEQVVKDFLDTLLEYAEIYFKILFGVLALASIAVVGVEFMIFLMRLLEKRYPG